MRTFSNGFQLIKCYLLFLVCIVYEFFKLEKKAQPASPQPPRSGIRICVQNYEENSDDDSSFRTSINTSRVSKASTQIDDDNNNDSNITPTLNNSIPRITPELLIVNSTPLNRFHHHSALSNRKGFRRDLEKLRYVNEAF